MRMDNYIVTNMDHETVDMNCNEVRLVGCFKFTSRPSHINGGVQFYENVLEVMRTSGVKDFVPIVLLSKDSAVATIGDTVEAQGTVMTHYQPEKIKKNKMYVMVKSIEKVLPDTPHENVVTLAGEISHYVESKYRYTPRGRRICDFIIQRPHRTKAYTYNLYAIAWGKNAELVHCFEKGKKIAIRGRFQSRVYEKSIDGNEIYVRTHEISVVKLLAIKL